MADNAMAFRAFCEHGKVRAMLVYPMIGEHCDEYKADAFKELARWYRKSDHVDIETARRSDMHCDVCDAPRKHKVSR